MLFSGAKVQLFRGKQNFSQLFQHLSSYHTFNSVNKWKIITLNILTIIILK